MVDNLLGNAWKYCRGVQQPEIHFGMVSTDMNSHTFYIKDNGVGFDSDNAEGIFSPFRRFHQSDEFEGTGIGLATVYRIVRRHGGNVWVNSKPGKGAVFYFTLSNGSFS